MAKSVVRVKAFSSARVKPKVTPDGSSLEEQMNAFCAPLAVGDFLGASIVVGQTTDDAGHMFTGFVVYKT